MVLKNVKHVNMNGNIEQEEKQRKKVKLDFDKVTFARTIWVNIMVTLRDLITRFSH